MKGIGMSVWASERWGGKERESELSEGSYTEWRLVESCQWQ